MSEEKFLDKEKGDPKAKDPPLELVVEEKKEKGHPHPPLKELAEESENAVLTAREMEMLDDGAVSQAELHRLMIITAQRNDEMCEAEYVVEDLALDIKKCESELKEYSTKITGMILAWFIRLYTGMPVKQRLEKRIDELYEKEEKAIKAFEEATEAWCTARDDEALQSSNNRTRKGGKL